MGRTLTPDGKRVSIGLKVSEAKAKAVDAARGQTPRALWIEAAIDAYLALPVTAGPPPPPPPQVDESVITYIERGEGRRARKRRASAAPAAVEEVRALAEAAGVPLVPASELPRACPHRIARGVYCKMCRVKKS